MFDTSRALQDMAQQIRSCRAQDGLTLQQLAQRSGVAASTIHKVEAQQMVPTVFVLLKIAKGLGRRPEELVRDRLPALQNGEKPQNSHGSGDLGASVRDQVGVWRIDLRSDQSLPALELEPHQRAIVLVDEGAIDLRAGDRRVRLDAGQCVEIEGGCIESHCAHDDVTRLTVIASPQGDLRDRLGTPSECPAIGT